MGSIEEARLAFPRWDGRQLSAYCCRSRPTGGAHRWCVLRRLSSLPRPWWQPHIWTRSTCDGPKLSSFIQTGGPCANRAAGQGCDRPEQCFKSEDNDHEVALSARTIDTTAMVLEYGVERRLSGSNVAEKVKRLSKPRKEMSTYNTGRGGEGAPGCRRRARRTPLPAPCPWTKVWPRYCGQRANGRPRNVWHSAPAYGDGDYVACDEAGRPYHPDALSKRWTKLVKDAGVRHINLHSARHTCGTTLHLRGVPLSVVAA
jgi:Phage integrase family